MQNERQSAYFLTPDEIWGSLFDRSRPDQSAIEKIEQTIFLRLIESTKNIITPKVMYFCDEEKARLKDRFTIAVSTRPIVIKADQASQTKDPVLEVCTIKGKASNQLHLKAISAATKGRQERFLQDLKEICSHRRETSAEDVGPDFVCFPEFAYPFPPAPKSGADLKGADKVALTRLLDVIETSNRLVFLGSAHVHEQPLYKNTGTISAFGPGSVRRKKDVFNEKLRQLSAQPVLRTLEFNVVEGEDGTEQLSVRVTPAEGEPIVITSRRTLKRHRTTLDQTQYETVRDAFDFFQSTHDVTNSMISINKKAAAVKLGEYLDPEPDPKFDVFVTPHGVVSVLICYDAYDPSMFLTATRMYQHSRLKESRFQHHGVDLFFVPSFNRSPQLVRMCEALSYLTNTVVVYVSGDSACETKSEVFICGRTASVCQSEMGIDVKDHFEKWDHRDSHSTFYRISKELLMFAMRFRHNKLGILGLGMTEAVAFQPVGRDPLA